LVAAQLGNSPFVSGSAQALLKADAEVTNQRSRLEGVRNLTT
jgi:hypothetical protein